MAAEPNFSVIKYQLDRQTDRQTDRGTERQTDGQTHRESDRETDRQRDRQTERRTSRQGENQRDRYEFTSSRVDKQKDHKFIWAENVQQKQSVVKTQIRRETVMFWLVSSAQIM